ncbi:MAG TPA: hypothetical protein VH393_14535, partial [Ktedonobacterales bacterium]
LRELHYLPIIFNFDRPRDRTYTETVQTLVGLSRFVIADLRGPSVPHELAATVPHFEIPFVFITRQGKKTWAMSTDLLTRDHVVKPVVVYADTQDLLDRTLSEIVTPAEEKHQARQKLLDALFRHN